MVILEQKPRGNKKRFWDLVVNNYTDEDCDCVRVLVSEKCEAYVIAKEIGSENGTPHLQGVIKLKNPQYLSYLINMFKDTCLYKRVSFREVRNAEAARNYCSGEIGKTASECWLKYKPELITFAGTYERKKKLVDQAKLLENHYTIHKFKFKKENISIEELETNWNYYKQRAEELEEEIKNCPYCKLENGYESE